MRDAIADDTRARTLGVRGALLLGALASVGMIAVLVFALSGVLSGQRPIGDGRDPATYGFDLGALSPDMGTLAGSGNPRDFLQPLTVTTTMPGSEMASWNESSRTKYIVTTDRVVGVQVGDESRAYPLSVLNVHEVIHDTIAGVPIAVTYSPLCDAAVVFDRRVGERIIEFGISGLVLDSNLLLYDRVESGGAPSLWSQLAFRCVSGPLVGTPLPPLPGVTIAAWKEWLAAHPGTLVPTPDDAMRKRIKATSYERYWLAGEPMYPVHATPVDAAGTIPAMTRVVATLEPDGRWTVAPAHTISVDGRTRVPCLWFAWYAFHGRESTLRGFTAP